VDRCALFVDAGYALADGAMAVHGTRRRDSVSWDHAGLLKLLAGLARDRTGLPVLRCYWYETAAEGRRTAEHDALAEMPGLKLRLVNTLPGRREGIESQLRRDLVTLAKSGAISDAFVASANEQIAEIVAEVQDLGLRVVILHIASDGGWTIPLPLRQECDDIVEISGVHLRSYVDLIKGAEPAALPAPGPVYKPNDAGEYRPDYLSAPSHSGAGQSARSAAPMSAVPVSKESSQPAAASQGSAAPAPQAPAQPYSTAGTSSGAYSMPDQQHFSQTGSGADYQSGAPSYQNGVPGNYQNAAQNGSGQAPAAANFDAQNGVSQSGAAYPLGGIAPSSGAQIGGGQNGAGPAHHGAGPGQHAAPHHGSSQHGLSQHGGAQHGVAQHGVGQHSAGPAQHGGSQEPAGDPGLNSLPAPGYQQQGGYQRGPDQHGPSSQNGLSYQVSGQNGTAQYGYSAVPPGQGTNGIGQSGQVNGGQAGYPSSQPGGGLPGYQQSNPSQNGGILPGQAPNGIAQPGYQSPPSSGIRGPVQGGFQPTPQQPDQRQRDPYGQSGLETPMASQGQYAFGAPDMGFGNGQPAGPGPGPDQAQRGGFAPNPAGQNVVQAVSVGQPQYQMQAQPGAPLPAVRQQPVAMALPDAVKAAHAEGFTFGESVGRDAPGLWLEAVLARKPRMPSDLEARLLQGSVLPIDSLLHDEVRHSLRRGFWDALESTRR
jgi:hypothetical protein